jgi:hypothetical protein
MRRLFALSAAVLAVAAAGSAWAQPRITTPVAAPPAEPETPIPSIAEDRAAAAALSAQIAALDQEIYTDEARMTQLRDAELAAQNTRLRAIRPAMKFRGPIVR